jgi:hypothetical protein
VAKVVVTKHGFQRFTDADIAGSPVSQARFATVRRRDRCWWR